MLQCAILQVRSLWRTPVRYRTLRHLCHTLYPISTSHPNPTHSPLRRPAVLRPAGQAHLLRRAADRGGLRQVQLKQVWGDQMPTILGARSGVTNHPFWHLCTSRILCAAPHALSPLNPRPPCCSGFVKGDNDVLRYTPQAFSHYTFELTRGKKICVDIQVWN